MAKYNQDREQQQHNKYLGISTKYFQKQKPMNYKEKNK